MIYDKGINSGNLNSDARFDLRLHEADALLALRGAGEKGRAGRLGGSTARVGAGAPRGAPGRTSLPSPRRRERARRRTRCLLAPGFAPLPCELVL